MNIIILNFTSVLAADTSVIVEFNVSQQVIYQYMQSINNEDWNAYKNCFSDDIQSELINFPSEKQIEEKIGILSVDNISLYEIKEIEYNIAQYIEPRIDIDNFGEYENIHIFYLGFDMSVSNESKYFYNGVNYYIIVTGEKDNDNVILQMESAYYFDRIDEVGISFGSDSEQIAAQIVEARKRGIIINSNAQVIDCISEAAENAINTNNCIELSTLISLSSCIYDGEEEPYINVYTGGEVKTLTLFNYTINVLPNEWYPSWDSASLQAGAIVIKMYGWYNILHPRYPATSYGADVTDSSSNYQEYVEGSAQIITTNAVRMVQKYALVKSDNEVFETQYRAGGYNGNGEGSDMLYQWGTQYLAVEEDMSFKEICEYYYNDTKWIILNID